MMRRFLYALMLTALPLAVAADMQKGDKTIPFETGDPAMETAIAEARASLPLFLDHTIGSEGMSVDGAMVKIAMPVEDGPVTFEHIWATPFRRLSDTAFVAMLANRPNNLPDYEVGDLVEFNATQVSDWAFFDESGVLYGGYSMRVIRDSGQATNEGAFDSLSEQPIPADWTAAQ